MQFFKISVILCFSVGLLLYSFSFFSPVNFSQLSLGRFAPNLVRTRCVFLHAIKTDEGDFWKVKKPGHNGQKKHQKIGQIFTQAVTFSLVVTKRLKFFEKYFLRWHLGCYIFQKNIFVTVQNRLVFSNTLLNGASKKTDNLKSYDQS